MAVGIAGGVGRTGGGLSATPAQNRQSFLLLLGFFCPLAWASVGLHFASGTPKLDIEAGIYRRSKELNAQVVVTLVFAVLSLCYLTIAIVRYCNKELAAAEKRKSQIVDNIVNHAIMTRFDTSGDGVISFEELANGLSSLGVQVDSSALRQDFKLFDKNGNGTLGLMEFVAFLTSGTIGAEASIRYKVASDSATVAPEP
jgi:hypothetical protein